MKVFKTVTKTMDVVDDIRCDSCNKSCLDDCNLNFEYMTLKAKWGYGSHHDTEEWEAQICEQCVINKLEPIINFFKRNYIA